MRPKLKALFRWQVFGFLVGILMSTFVIDILSEPERDPCPMNWNSADARRHQSLICNVEVRQEGGKKEVPIEEAWVEAATKNKHFLVWFPYEERLDFNFLCVRLPISKEAAYKFTLERDGEDFKVLGTSSNKFIYYARSETDDLHPQPITAKYAKYVHGTPRKVGSVTFAPVIPR